MNKEDSYSIGFIMRPHGLKGELTISLSFDAPERWATIKSVFVDKNGSLVPYFIEWVNIQKNRAILKFEEVSSYDQAALLKGYSLYLPIKQRPKLKKGEFYDDEIIDFQIVDESLGLLGVVKNVERSGISRFLIVNYHEKELLIPVQYPILKSVNKSKKEISVNLPDGFLDI